ncbi:lipopolysaccharide cholinephosphotransferase licD [Elysia marginata]|uniref:Lipopolysaccharide cholinephosphotransferase licD n=1 Tax=Elysia marginata TaxID=1093978 RepID=A0AAV4IGK3_9GAST|nr:lipopolysaccharide cholinephosphotransferase licD [Elysia marginata]
MLTSLSATGRINHNEPEIPDSVKTFTSHSKIRLFQRGLSIEEREILLFVFQKFVQACENRDVTFFLYGGSLLGSFRHHDLVPWDDDIDILISAKDRQLLRKAVLALKSEGFALYDPEDYGKAWKFYWKRTKTLQNKPYQWPYIDIFFYLQNATHIFDLMLEYRSLYVFKISDVFPLTVRPFAGAFLPVPCNIEVVVKENYSPNLCKSLHYEHKRETSRPQQTLATISCKALHDIYPFVHRRLSPKGDAIVEEIKMGNETFRTLQIVQRNRCQGNSGYFSYR